jgi:hypothetical protein
MPVSGVLRRLLHIRDLEEEQHRLALESARGELRRLESALAYAAARRRLGRDLAEGRGSSESIDRQAGVVEAGAAYRLTEVLVPRIGESQEETARRSEEFLSKRVERMQAETLIEATEAADAVEAARRGQQALDEWYRSRLHRLQSNAKEPDERPDLRESRDGVDEG